MLLASSSLALALLAWCSRLPLLSPLNPLSLHLPFAELAVDWSGLMAEISFLFSELAVDWSGLMAEISCLFAELAVD
jgi:hypothetical protein